MGLTLRPLACVQAGPEELCELQRVLEGAPTYYRRTTGGLPGPDEARHVLTALPENADPRDKFDWGIDSGPQMVGCIDVIRGWPTPATATIGLLLVDEAHARQGTGRAGYQAREVEIGRWPGIRTLRATVVETNADVLAFWHRMGFAETGEVRPYRHGELVSRSIVLTKSL